MAEIQRIEITRKQTEQVFKRYTSASGIELLSILGGESIVVPENQQQHTDSVGFDTNIVSEAKQELIEEGVETETIEFTHNHNRDSGHGFEFSQEDLDTAKRLHATHGIDRMGLIMNGKQLDDNSMVQHKVVANQEGELHTLEGDEGTGKVVTMYTNEQGEQKTIFSESIQQAEQKEQLIITLKQKLFEEPELAEVINIEDILEKAA